MAARIEGIFDEATKKSILNSRLLIVGAGGIGCELLKNLVMHGFGDLHVMDLDTIDVSNLNRQFLFHKQHVGKSKAEVAKESALRFNPRASITPYHDSITNRKYGIEFFQDFSAVVNALDNIAARSHVNRMCLASNIPLLESGSAGYLGQVTVYKKKETECYECLPRPAPKTYPGCTIRNTPSELIHCVVWAKHLFNQLFGEEDADQDVSPDPADKEISMGSTFKLTGTGNIKRVSTRAWAKGCNYDPKKLFNKLFDEDIKYLLTMSDLWSKRVAPAPLEWENLPDAVAGSSKQERSSLKDQEIWSVKECVDVFTQSLKALRLQCDESGSDDVLVWDKDDIHGMNFVASCANLRAYCFHIKPKSKFKLKSMAGNIIPAIATTNAVIAGILVLQLVKVLKGDITKCRTVVINKGYRVTKKFLSPVELSKPNSNCLVCSPNMPEVSVKVNLTTFTVKSLQEKVLKEKLCMVAPDALVVDGKGTILVSSEPEDMEGILEKTLSNMKIESCNRLQCDDFFQHSKFTLTIMHDPTLNEQDFIMLNELNLKEAQEASASTSKKAASPPPDKDDDIMDADEDIVEIPNVVSEEQSPSTDVKKPISEVRDLPGEENGEPPLKKMRAAE